jgi:hypothetical protein
MDDRTEKRFVPEVSYVLYKVWLNVSYISDYEGQHPVRFYI